MRTNKYHNKIELSLSLHFETEKAVLVSLDGNKEASVWVPKVFVEIKERKGTVIEVMIPERMAYEKGLI